MYKGLALQYTKEDGKACKKSDGKRLDWAAGISAEIDDIEDEDECASKCIENPLCSIFNHSSTLKRCLLKMDTVDRIIK